MAMDGIKTDEDRIEDISTKAELEKVFQQAGDNLIVVHFFATWCGPCRQVAPRFKELSEKYENCIFLRVDTDVSEDIPTEYEITVMPTFILVKKGKTLDVMTGANADKLELLIVTGCGGKIREEFARADRRRFSHVGTDGSFESREKKARSSGCDSGTSITPSVTWADNEIRNGHPAPAETAKNHLMWNLECPNCKCAITMTSAIQVTTTRP